MLLHPSFVTLIFVLSAFGASIKRDVAQVEKDIENLEVQTNSLDASVNAFPNSGGTLAQAMAIHDKAINLGSAIQSATADMTASSAFTDSESNTVVGLTGNLQSAVTKGLSDLVNKKSALTAMKVNPIVEDDLIALQKDTQDFGTTYMTKISSSMASTAQEQVNVINSALDAAVQAYAS